MNRFLRTAPTRQLIAVLAGICALIAVGSTLALAASGGGPVPPSRPLAQAIHDALAAPQVPGIAADVSFKNNLIDASELEGTDPLLAGGTGRMWLSNDHRFRLELQTSGGSEDAQVVVDQRRFWAYDPSSNTVYQGTLPAGGVDRPDRAIPSVSAIERKLQRVMQHAELSGAMPGDIAGRPAYTVRVSPKDTGGLIGGAELAWDAARGVPLRVALYARGDAAPVLELDATNVSYGPQSASVFSISPPPDAKLVNVDTRRVNRARAHSGKRDHARREQIAGVAAVSAHLPFTLDAPDSLAGLRRESVSLIGASRHPGALLVYGHGLGSIIVLEQPASRPADAPQTGDRQGLNLPTIQVNGTAAQELDTALGTIVRFNRSGVSYTVAGSVRPAAADAAARGL